MENINNNGVLIGTIFESLPADARDKLERIHFEGINCLSGEYDDRPVLVRPEFVGFDFGPLSEAMEDFDKARKEVWNECFDLHDHILVQIWLKFVLNAVPNLRDQFKQMHKQYEACTGRKQQERIQPADVSFVEEYILFEGEKVPPPRILSQWRPTQRLKKQQLRILHKNLDLGQKACKTVKREIRQLESQIKGGHSYLTVEWTHFVICTEKKITLDGLPIRDKPRPMSAAKMQGSTDIH